MILTVDAVITVKGGKVVLIRRAKEPFRGKYAFPGGHAEDEDQSLRHAAARELAEEINFRAEPDELELLTVLDAPGRDPRPGRRAAFVFHLDLPDESRLAGCRAGSDAASFHLVDIRSLSKDDLAFDHYLAVEAIKNNTP